MGEVSIRRATPDDADAFVDIMWSVGAEGRWIATEVPFDRVERARKFRATAARDTDRCFVAELGLEGGQAVVGHLALQRTAYGTFELGMTIRDGYRGQGIGRALMEAALAWARTTDAHKVELQVWPDNDRALALYARFGFTREGYLRRHYRRRDGSLRDAVVMGLLLSSE